MFSCSCSYCATCCWGNLLRADWFLFTESWLSAGFYSFWNDDVVFRKSLLRSFFIISTFFNAAPPNLSVSSAVVSGRLPSLCWLSRSVFPLFSLLLLSTSSHPWEYAVSIFASLFPAFLRRREISQGIRGLWCNIIQSFFSCSSPGHF